MREFFEHFGDYVNQCFWSEVFGFFKLPELCNGKILVQFILEGDYSWSIRSLNFFAMNGTRSNQNFVKK